MASKPADRGSRQYRVCDRRSARTGDDASRTGAVTSAHYGIGLFTAAEIARNHGGSLELSNRASADGSPAGARVVFRLPLA